MSLISSESLTLAYEGRPVATDIHFEVNAGDYLCIVGENGSGKSTLVRAILGMHAVYSGTLTVRPEVRAAGIGYLPQQTAAQRDFPASVREVVLSGRLRHIGARPFFNRSDRRTAETVMRRMGVAELLSRPYRELSGGQQQRVLLSRAVCAAGDLLLLDEPASGLDPMAVAEMYELIESLHRTGVAVVMVTHDMQAAVTYADHILHMGATNFFGTTEAYLRTPAGRRFDPLRRAASAVVGGRASRAGEAETA